MKKKGFTLIELIVVIAIIGVLAAILVPAMMGYVKKSKITSANSAAKSIYTGAQSAVTDMNAEDAAMASLNTWKTATGATLQTDKDTLTGWKSSTDAAKTFQYRIYNYFNDIYKLDSVALMLDDNYQVKGVGVKDKQGYLGSHPKQMTVDKYDDFMGANPKKDKAADALGYAAS